MTALTLLLWIALGIGLQLALWLGSMFWRHWQEYQVLKSGGSEPEAIPAASQAETGAVTPAGWSGFRPFRVERKQYEDLAQAICSFYLVPEDGQPLPGFYPGQFLTFRMDVPTAEGRQEQIIRCYSLSDAPSPDYYRVSIKRVMASSEGVPPGRSSNYFHDHVVAGSVLHVRAPSGHFYLERGNFPVVLIGGGIGITPMLSMINWCLAEQPEREIWLFYGVRNSRELVMRPQLEALAETHPNFHLYSCFSDPLPEDQPGRDFRHHGRVDVTLLRLLLPLKHYHFYICGPTPMMASLVAGLEEWGVPEPRIHFEAFGPASIKRKSAPVEEIAPSAGGEGVLVTFARSGKQFAWQASAANLLEFAEANGIAVDSGCRAGGCGTCQTTIKSGEVSYLQPPDFDPEPGNCLPCVCKPRTSVTLEA